MYILNFNKICSPHKIQEYLILHLFCLNVKVFNYLWNLYSDNHHHFRMYNYFIVINVYRVQINFKSSNLYRMFNISEINSNTIINMYLKLSKLI